MRAFGVDTESLVDQGLCDGCYMIQILTGSDYGCERHHQDRERIDGVYQR